MDAWSREALLSHSSLQYSSSCSVPVPCGPSPNRVNDQPASSFSLRRLSSAAATFLRGRGITTARVEDDEESRCSAAMADEEAGESDIGGREAPKALLPLCQARAVAKHPKRPENEEFSASISFSSVGEPTRGCIYFVRHGESAANEANVYSGNVWDVELTAFGQLQARNGGKVCASKGLRFDEVHVSNLRRAKDTMRLLLEEAQHPAIPTFETPALAERNFGVWTRRNKNLLQRSFGYENFEHLLQSPNAAPLHGESLAQMYGRTRSYFLDVLCPARDSGKTVLVVCHQYILEMVGLILCDMPPEEYFDFSLPNAKPMSEEELKTYVKEESQTRKEVADWTTINFASIFLGALLLGAVLRIWCTWEPSTVVFQALLAVTLGGSSFAIMLDVDLGHTIHSRKARKVVTQSLLPWALRYALAIVVFLVGRSYPKLQQMTLLFLVPPALTCPTLCQLWGGDFHVGLSSTILHSLLSPLLLVLLYALDHATSNAGETALSLSSLKGFFFILGAGLLFPTAAAQVWRIVSPVESKKLSNKYKFLGIWSMALLALVGSYRFCRRDTWTTIFEHESTGADPNNLYNALMHLLIVLAAFVVLKFSSSVVARQFGTVNSVFVTEEPLRSGWWSVVIKSVRLVKDRVFTFCTSPTAIDVFTTFGTPNVFLALALLPPVPVPAAAMESANGLGVPSDSTGFWMLVLFFVGTSLDDARIVAAHSRDCLLSDIQAHPPQPSAQGWLNRVTRSMLDTGAEAAVRRRFFVLTATKLQYFINEAHFYSQGSITLTAQSRVLRWEDLSDADALHFGRRPLTASLHPSVSSRRFYLIASSKLFELEADTATNRSDWIAQLTRVIGDLQTSSHMAAPARVPFQIDG